MIGKRLKNVYKAIEHGKVYSLEDAVALVKKNATARFDETVEIAIQLGIDVSKTDQHVRGVALLPHGTGKSYRVAVFARGPQADEAKTAGADIVGAEDLIDEIQKGVLNFDRCAATPDLMPLVSRVAKVLGPRGLMPSPKTGTVSANIALVVKAIKGGQIEFRSEKGGVVHAGVGKASFAEEALQENISFLIKTIRDEKGASVKGAFIKKATISSTMGAGVQFSL
ncbi:MAG: 50S ribosomal protein L1 [Holosporales bacterium]|jgi:large subunit ribosomal protein L1|nr:50S ribosomal protein L1 [Holosporales bacterium]